MTTQILTTKRRLILYDDSLTSHASGELFTVRHWARHGPLRGAGGGRGNTWIVAGDRDEWVLRHYHRGGLAAYCSRDHYLWTGRERTRPWREWQLLALLYKEGLPVPQPVAAQVVRLGPWYRGDLITRRIADGRSLAACLRNPRIELIPWRAIGACIRRFHDAGVYHADLNAHNILINTRNEIFVIDFDRGERRTPRVLWQEANLRRLLRSMRKLSTPGLAEAHAWSALREGYNGKPG
ncbi:MAG: 3-deoxy-D-manno-octulosonic acid kinase [Gammaproteobacteria bacterium]